MRLVVARESRKWHPPTACACDQSWSPFQRSCKTLQNSRATAARSRLEHKHDGVILGLSYKLMQNNHAEFHLRPDSYLLQYSNMEHMARVGINWSMGHRSKALIGLTVRYDPSTFPSLKKVIHIYWWKQQKETDHAIPHEKNVKQPDVFLCGRKTNHARARRGSALRTWNNSLGSWVGLVACESLDRGLCLLGRRLHDTLAVFFFFLAWICIFFFHLALF